ncbi:MAG: AAA family ATPase, partial [Anaerolineae bacterium]
ITLLFGRNSSGKSALIRALLLLRQSLGPGEKGTPFLFEDLYGVDLGGFKEAVHNGQTEKHIWFHFRCSSSEIQDMLAKPGFAGVGANQTAAIEVALGYAAYRETREKIDPTRIELADLQLRLTVADQDEQQLLFQAGLLEPEDAALFDGERWYVEGLLAHRGEPGAGKGFGCELGWGFLDLKFIQPQTDDRGNYNFLSELFRMLKGEIAGFLDGIVHLGPIRPEPQRRYSFDRATAFEWRSRDWTAFLDFIGGKLRQEHIDEIGFWLERLQLAKRPDSHLASEIGALVAEFEVGVIENDQSPPRPLSAMGFGTSQVLPVIVQCVTAKPGSLVIVEQPELHLHPSAQARLGDMFINSILGEALPMWRQEVEKALREHRQPPEIPRATNKLPPPGPRLLIETHSEHLLLRFRRRIAETFAYELKRIKANEHPQTGQELLDWPLNTDDLCFHFIYRDSIDSKVVQIGINEQGELDSSKAPSLFDDFFADDLIELAALVSALP